MPQISPTPARSYYVVGGTAQKLFFVNWAFFQASDIKVVTLDADGAEVSLDFSATPQDSGQFAVSGVQDDRGGYSSGTVTIGGDGVSNKAVLVYRDILPGRDTEFPDPASFIEILALNIELSRVNALIVDILEKLSRCISTSIVNSGLSLTLPLLVAGRALKVGPNADSIVLSNFDPDSIAGDAADAAETAANALALAQDALATAANALAMVGNATGAASIHEFMIQLEAGVNDYLLPIAAASEAAVTLFYGVQIQSSANYSITDTLAPGRTLHLIGSVVIDGTPGSWAAGDYLYGRVTGFVTDSSIGPRSIAGRHLADGSIDDPRLIAPAVITADKLAGGLDLGGVLADSSIPLSALDGSSLSPNTPIGFDASGNPISVPIPTYSGTQLIDLGTVDLTGLNSATWEISGEDVDEIKIIEIFINGATLGPSTEQLCLVALTGSLVEAISGYSGKLAGMSDSSDGGSNVAHPYSSSFILSARTDGRPFCATALRLIRLQDNTWGIGGTGINGAGFQLWWAINGLVVLGSNLTGLRLRSSSGSQLFSGGIANIIGWK